GRGSIVGRTVLARQPVQIVDVNTSQYAFADRAHEQRRLADSAKSVGGRRCSRLLIGSKSSACPSTLSVLPKTVLISRSFLTLPIRTWRTWVSPSVIAAKCCVRLPQWLMSPRQWPRRRLLPRTVRQSRRPRLFPPRLRRQVSVATSQ